MDCWISGRRKSRAGKVSVLMTVEERLSRFKILAAKYFSLSDRDSVHIPQKRWRLEIFDLPGIPFTADDG